jgi:hypothetical protein
MDSFAHLSKMENRDKIYHRNVKSLLEPLEDDGFLLLVMKREER